MRQNVKAYLNDRLPTGISYRTKDGNLWVSKYREIKHNGEKVSKRLAETVKLGITPDMTDAKCKEQIDNAISSAVKVRNSFAEKLASKSFMLSENTKVKATGTLLGIYEDLKRLDTWKGKHASNIDDCMKDILDFFSEPERDIKNPTVAHIHNEFTLHDLKKYVAERILSRPMNTYGTASGKTINRRLGVLRMITKQAIKSRLFNADDVLDPSNQNNYGITNVPEDESKPKAPLSLAEEDQLLDCMLEYKEDYWYDVIAFAIDTGVRHVGELDSITPEQVNFRTGIMTFFRPKTGKWTTMKLTQRAFEIVRRRREVALANPKNVFFPVTKGSIRHNWQKWNKKAGLVYKKDGVEKMIFSEPYTTRHTYITRLVEAGVQAKAVQELAGHKSFETTMKYYIHSTNDILTDATAKLEEYKKKKQSARIVKNVTPTGGNVRLDFRGRAITVAGATTKRLK
mgnify:FL=1